MGNVKHCETPRKEHGVYCLVISFHPSIHQIAFTSTSLFQSHLCPFGFVQLLGYSTIHNRLCSFSCQHGYWMLFVYYTILYPFERTKPYTAPFLKDCPAFDSLFVRSSRNVLRSLLVRDMLPRLIDATLCPGGPEATCRVKMLILMPPMFL